MPNFKWRKKQSDQKPQTHDVTGRRDELISHVSEQQRISAEAIEASWHEYLIHGQESEFRYRHLLGMLPSNPRCLLCNAPFRGPGGIIARNVFNKRPSKMNPRMCNVCDEFGAEHQGGAEVELSLMFADVRGSTPIAESMSPTEFGKLIDRFYKATSKVLIQSDALIDKIIGDQVSGMYLPGFVGPDHAMRAIEAAKEVLKVTGRGCSYRSGLCGSDGG
jgi:adenylate cyclase